MIETVGLIAIGYVAFAGLPWWYAVAIAVVITLTHATGRYLFFVRAHGTDGPQAAYFGFPTFLLGSLFGAVVMSALAYSAGLGLRFIVH